MNSTHPEYLTFRRMCLLYDPQTPIEAKLTTVRDLLREEKGLETFSAIKSFLLDHEDEITEADLNSIRNIRSAREKFLSSYSSIDSSLIYIKSIFLQFLNTLRWIPREEYRLELTSTLQPVIEDPSLQSFQILESLFEYEKLNNNDLLLNFQYFTDDYLTNIWSILALDFMNVNTPEVRRSLMSYCLRSLESGNYNICYQVLKTLGHLKVQETDIYVHMFDFLNHEDNGIVYYALYSLAYSEVEYPQVHFEIVKKLYHENFWIRLQAIRTLDYLDLIEQEPEVKNILREIQQTEKHPRVIQELRQKL